MYIFYCSPPPPPSIRRRIIILASERVSSIVYCHCGGRPCSQNMIRGGGSLTLSSFGKHTQSPNRDRNPSSPWLSRKVITAHPQRSLSDLRLLAGPHNSSKRRTHKNRQWNINFANQMAEQILFPLISWFTVVVVAAYANHELICRAEKLSINCLSVAFHAHFLFMNRLRNLRLQLRSMSYRER